jgi:two-component system OmpR family response regulator
MVNILVVEDDPNVRRLTCLVLDQNGYSSIAAADGQAALDVLERTHVDLAIVDIMMPGIDGLELTRRLRASGNNLPILIVTAKGEMRDKRAGFSSGADDYLVKPIDEEELIMRVGALLRRARIANEHRLTVGATTLDSDSYQVSDANGTQELPRLEFELLFKLLSYPGMVFTRRQLLNDVWGPSATSDERTVDVHVSHLRDRFSDNPDFQIVTLRGLGYKAVITEQPLSPQASSDASAPGGKADG